MESIFYSKEILDYKDAIKNAMNDRPEYANLIKSVWQNFVAYLGASDYGRFSEETYANEFYLVTVAKVICANILNGKPLISSEKGVRDIMNGNYFKQKNIINLVDYDYFGWLNSSPYIDSLLENIMHIQQRLVCYDFQFMSEKDLFGELLAQLSNREHRLLLGQDFTLLWVANSMVCNILDGLQEEPHMLDMCCGSGVFLIETIKEVRKKYEISVETYSDEKDNMIYSCVMGFDIDPLAVMLAKVNWVLSMRDLFARHKGPIAVPVYHADSLFVATPITHSISSKLEGSYVLHFDGNSVEIPTFMLTPKHRKTFDAFMSKCYRFAMTRAELEKKELTDIEITQLTAAVEYEANIDFTATERQQQRLSAYSLILQLEALQRAGKNGIWYFVLNNSYKPGLVTNQFNCIISNPPWLAMSKLADNPYKKTLQEKANLFGIKPPGASHLHMELATTFLLASVDRYLKDGARWMMVMPGSLLSGYHHDPICLERYKSVLKPVAMKVDTIWELPTATFKNKAIVLGGEKSEDSTQYPLAGRVYDEPDNYIDCDYTLTPVYKFADDFS